MGEHAPFSAQAAAATLAEAARYEDALRQRTEGLTNVIWGIVSPAIFATYAMYALAVGDDVGALEGAVFSVLWAPWVAAGVLATWLLWRSAALSAPRLGEGQPSGVLISAGWLVIYVAAVAGAVILVPAINEPTYALLALGVAWTVFGVVNLYKCSPRGRRLDVAVGAVVLVVAVALALSLPEDPEAGYALATWVAMATSSVAPIAAGVWQATRG